MLRNWSLSFKLNGLISYPISVNFHFAIKLDFILGNLLAKFRFPISRTLDFRRSSKWRSFVLKVGWGLRESGALSLFQLKITESVCERPLWTTWVLLLWPTWLAAAARKPTLLFVTERGSRCNKLYSNQLPFLLPWKRKFKPFAHWRIRKSSKNLLETFSSVKNFNQNNSLKFFYIVGDLKSTLQIASILWIQCTS